MGKEMEGDNRQRRRRAADAREEGQSPSAAGVTTGASDQRRHLGDDADHGEKISGPGWGKQQPDRVTAEPRPGSVGERSTPGPEPTPTPAPAPKSAASAGDLDPDESRVLNALAALEVRHGAPTVGAIAREVGLSVDKAAPVVQRLVSAHDVVQHVPAAPDGEDLGERYRVKSRV